MSEVKGKTVAELIAALQQMDPTMEVNIDGCDCAGPAGDVEVRGPYTYPYSPEMDQPAHVSICRADLVA